MFIVCAALTGVAWAASTDFVELASSPEPVDDPVFVAAADLDGDTDRDLAVANSPGSVTILKNFGGGDFFQTVSSPVATGAGPRSIAAADLDGDADQDLAVANINSDNVTILRNRGAGNFVQPPWSPEAVGASPVSVAAADLDGDTHLDLAVTNSFAANVTILMNNGSGNFVRPASSPEAVENHPESIVAADLDGDADQDLAVANQFSDNVTILRNTGSGDFVERGTSPEPAGEFPASLVATDLDGDTDQDLAIANAVSDDVTIFATPARETSTSHEPGAGPGRSDLRHGRGLRPRWRPGPRGRERGFRRGHNPPQQRRGQLQPAGHEPGVR